MRVTLAAIVTCALLGMAVSLTSCGDGDTAASGKEPGAQSKGKATAAPTAGCGRPLRRFVGRLDALRDAVAVGVTYDSYLAAVRALRAGYDRLPVGRLAVGCLLAVGDPAERSLNAYSEAANTWGNCLADTACRIASIEPTLRRTWERASARLSAAQAGRRAM